MATPTFVTDLQAMNPTVVQVHQNSKSPVTSHSAQGQKTATLIQSTHGTQQQFIVTSSVAEALTEQNASNQENIINQAGQVYPAHVQQYGTEYTGQTAVYNASTGTYYQTGAGQVATGISNMGMMQGHILTQQGGNTYLIQGGTMDGEGTPLTHTTRASPATDELYNRSQEVQWLMDNYETADGVSLPRSTLYNHYLRHCQEQNLDPMNPASFGKLIRSVFLGLRTRRLGTSIITVHPVMVQGLSRAMGVEMVGVSVWVCLVRITRTNLRCSIILVSPGRAVFPCRLHYVMGLHPFLRRYALQAADIVLLAPTTQTSLRAIKRMTPLWTQGTSVNGMMQ